MGEGTFQQNKAVDARHPKVTALLQTICSDSGQAHKKFWKLDSQTTFKIVQTSLTILSSSPLQITSFMS